MSTSGTDPAILVGLQQAYQKVTPTTRQLRPDDRLVDDLRLDSVAALELLLIVEEQFEVQLFGDPRAQRAVTVGDLAALIETVRSPGPAR